MWLVLLFFLLFSGSTAAEPCPSLSPDDDIPDSCALQELLDRGGRIELAAPADSESPGYILDLGLRLWVRGTTVVGPGAGPKARIVADPDIAEAMLAAKADDYTLANVIFDGNRDQRRHMIPSCVAGRGNAYNLILRGANFVVHGLESTHALCGSAMAVEGRDFRIHDNWIADNGWDIFEKVGGKLEVWADGMTVWRCERGQIYDNWFEDNTDIDLVVGGGPGCQVLNNEIHHVRKYGFGGIHVGWFPNGDGNHEGSIFEGNRIVSEPNRLHFGLLVGFHPWNRNIWLEDGGRIADN